MHSIRPAQALIALSLCGALLQGCAKDGYVPPEVLNTPATNLSDALSAFATKTQSESLNGYRRAAREDMIRSDINDFLLTGKYDGAHLTAAMRTHQVLLCKPRYGYLRIAIPLQNTSARATAIKNILQAPSSDVPTLLKALTDTYKVDPTITKLATSYDVWLKDADQGKPCADADTAANPFETRSYIGNEIGPFELFTAGKAAFDAIWGVVKPVVTGILQNVDQERRTKAVKDYFSDPINVGALKDDVKHTENFLNKEFAYSQHKTAGVAVASVRALQNIDGAGWKAALVVLKSPDCAGIAVLKTDRTDPGAVACVTKVNAALDSSVKAALDASDAFDVNMDRQLPAKPLSDQIETVAKIARGEIPPEDELKALWGTLIRYATLFDTVDSAASADNQKKINDAIDAFKKALNGGN